MNLKTINFIYNTVVENEINKNYYEQIRLNKNIICITFLHNDEINCTCTYKIHKNMITHYCPLNMLRIIMFYDNIRLILTISTIQKCVINYKIPPNSGINIDDITKFLSDQINLKINTYTLRSKVESYSLNKKLCINTNELESYDSKLNNLLLDCKKKCIGASVFYKPNDNIKIYVHNKSIAYIENKEEEINYQKNLIFKQNFFDLMTKYLSSKYPNHEFEKLHDNKNNINIENSDDDENYEDFIIVI